MLFVMGSPSTDRVPPDTWVIVPAYNEGAAIIPVLASLLSTAAAIVVVDDGSTDDTAVLARAHPVHLLRHPVNLGQGAAIQTGFDYAMRHGAQILVTFDADGQMDENEIPKLCSELVSRDLDIVMGSRFLDEVPRRMPRLKRWVLRWAAVLSRLTTGIRVTDAHNGFRALRRSAAMKIRLHCNRMAHASEFLYLIRQEQLSYGEVPVSIRYTPYSLAKGQRLSNAVNILWDLLFS